MAWADKGKQGIESRRSPRAPIKGSVSFSISPKMRRDIELLEKNVHGELVDISKLGVGLSSKIFLPKGALIHGNIPTQAFLSPSRKGIVRFVGMVLQSRMAGINYHLGVEFKRIAKRDVELISDYVRKKLDSK